MYERPIIIDRHLNIDHGETASQLICKTYSKTCPERIAVVATII